MNFKKTQSLTIDTGIKLPKRTAFQHLGWKSIPGQRFPEPVFKDSREDFEESLVRNVLNWMQAEMVKNNNSTRHLTGHRIQVTSTGWQWAAANKNTPTASMPTKAVYAEFFFQVVEIKFGDPRTGMLIGKHQYLSALTDTGQIIVGPKLGFTQVGHITSNLGSTGVTNTDGLNEANQPGQATQPRSSVHTAVLPQGGPSKTGALHLRLRKANSLVGGSVRDEPQRDGANGSDHGTQPVRDAGESGGSESV